MANENRLIDGFALLDKALLHYTECERNGKLVHASCEIKQKLADMVCEAPTVDAVEVVHSWWEKSVEGYKICHHCKADVAIFSGHKNYCPNCGAKMDGGNEDV